MNKFITLMQREWLQHRTGWRVLMGLPLVLMLGLALLDGRGLHIQVDGDGQSLPPMAQLPVALQTLVWTAGTAAITFVLACLSVLAQLPGLARRDVQDRSIEFWRSLPTSDVDSVGATVFTHLLVLPCLAVGVALLGAQLVALLAVVSTQGPLAWLQQPWWLVLSVVAAGFARLVLGFTLAVVWLSPVLLLTMAASAWLKRWAVPVVVVASVAGVQLVDRYLPVPMVKPALTRISTEALSALLSPRALEGIHFDGPTEIAQALPGLPGWLMADAGRVLANAVSPAFVLALGVGVLGFALMVLRRRRGV